MLSLLAAVAFASTPSVTPPIAVKIGTHIIAMRDVDTRAQSFYADFYLWLRFTSDDEEKINLITQKLEPLNGHFDSFEETDRKHVNGEWYVCFRVMGTFFFKQDLRKYPFDTQTLDLQFENARLYDDEMVFIVDTDAYKRGKTDERLWGVNPDLSIAEYRLRDVTSTVVAFHYPTDFGDPERQGSDSTNSRFIVRVSFEREAWSYAFKILVPLLIILAMAYLVFFLPPDQLDTAAAVSVTALLSCMAYNVAVTQNMPDIGYLVLSDKFFIATYTLLLLTLIETFYAYHLVHHERLDDAVKLEKRSRWVFPLGVAAIFVWLGASATLFG